MGLFDCKIVKKSYISNNQFMLDVFSEEITRESTPGQFVDILCDSLLRRPISICKVDRAKGIFSLGIRIVGSGTAYLGSKNPGETISVLGPLGNGFNLAGTKKCVVAGGGIGIFPLIYVLQEAREMGIETVSVCGFRSKEDSFLLDEIRSLSDNVVFSSDCGDLDFCGNAVDALNTIDLKDATIFTCGPSPMIRGVCRIAIERNVSCQVSLEERMGCGTGICLVCACKVKASKENMECVLNDSGIVEFDYKRCCKEGPVFDAREVVWD
ncbi:MAG: dihydroorotate dehydrogenase electron transfer subunit [Saccharofermentanales bacterium]